MLDNVMTTIAGHIAKTNRLKFESCNNLNAINFEFNEINNDTTKEMKKATYNVEINKTLLLCLSFTAFLFATRQLRVVGIPVVVKARHIIKKLKRI